MSKKPNPTPTPPPAQNTALLSQAGQQGTLVDPAQDTQAAEQAEAQRQSEQAEVQRQAEQAEAQRQAEQAEAQRQAEQAEARRQAEQAEAQRQAEQAEARQLEAEKRTREAAARVQQVDGLLLRREPIEGIWYPAGAVLSLPAALAEQCRGDGALDITDAAVQHALANGAARFSHVTPSPTVAGEA